MSDATFRIVTLAAAQDRRPMDAIGRFRQQRPHLLAPLIPLHWLLQRRGYPQEAAALLADLHAAFPNDSRLPTLASAAERLQNPTLTQSADPR